jgi:hypothetical protein
MSKGNAFTHIEPIEFEDSEINFKDMSFFSVVFSGGYH